VLNDGSILLVDDDRALREAVGRALRLEGYRVLVAAEGREALALLGSHEVDLVVLDVSMPVMDGIEMCRRMRAADDQASVLMLTARDAVADRVEGLDVGADDYLVKPFVLDELLARVRAGIRRAARVKKRATVAEDSEQDLRFGDLHMDLALHEAYRGGRRLKLTRTEYRLLELLLRNPRRVLSRSLLFERIWGYDLGESSKVLDVYVSYLRRKMEAAGEPRILRTVRAVGYVLREPR
jgi:two-component system response regulator MprA